MAALCVWVISIRFPRPKRQNQNSHFQADFKKKILPVHFSCVTIKYPLREVSGFDKQIPASGLRTVWIFFGLKFETFTYRAGKAGPSPFLDKFQAPRITGAQNLSFDLAWLCHLVSRHRIQTVTLQDAPGSMFTTGDVSKAVRFLLCAGVAIRGELVHAS